MTDTLKVYLDSNVFITAFETIGARSDHAWWLLDAIETGALAGVTSELTLSEILVKPMEAGDEALTTSYQDMLTNSAVMTVLPVLRSVLVDAARIRAWRPSVRLPDAVHIATASAAGCIFFVSNDDRLAVPEAMTRLSLTPFILDDMRATRP